MIRVPFHHHPNVQIENKAGYISVPEMSTLRFVNKYLTWCCDNNKTLKIGKEKIKKLVWNDKERTDIKKRNDLARC